MDEEYIEDFDEDFDYCCFDPYCDLCHGKALPKQGPKKQDVQSGGFNIKLGDFLLKGK